MRSICLLLLLLGAASCSMQPRHSIVNGKSASLASDETPPVADRRPQVDTNHGDERVDDYGWLRDKEAPDVIAHLEAENAYADRILAPTRKLEDELYDEILGRIEQTDLSVPYRLGEYFYYSRTEEGKQYPIHCRKQGSLEAPETIILDVNALAEGEAFMAVGVMTVSDDGQLLAYSIDNTGFRDYTLHVKDLRTGQLGPERIEKVKSVAWAADGRTLFYATDDDTKRPWRIYRHTLGATDDTLVLEEADERFRVGVRRSRSLEYVLISSASHTTSETRFLKADQPEGEFQLIQERSPDHEYEVDHRGAHFYMLTNDRGRNFRVVTAPVDSPGQEHWEELVPHSDAVMRERLMVFAGHMVLGEREDGMPQLQITDLASGAAHRIGFPEPVYSVFAARNPEFATTDLRFSYQSLSTPDTVFDYDMNSRARTQLKQDKVLGGYDPSRYRSERSHALAEDGTRVPISLVYHESVTPHAGNPMLLTGYGSYGFPYPVTFSHARVSLLDRGVIFAIAHVRGGGDLGKAWHDAGRMANKMNTFTDFIAVASHLIDSGYTRKDLLVIEGGSAGGLLMGAVSNLRPDLFRGVISHVPFVDVLNTMLDEDLPLTVGEFEEWGNPKIEEHYRGIRAYCPYSNIEARDYPAMLIKTSLNDSQVMYWEPAKYVAKLRAHKTDRNPVLFKINMSGGHGGSSGRYDRIREVALDYAFALTLLGVVEPR